MADSPVGPSPERPAAPEDVDPIRRLFPTEGDPGHIVAYRNPSTIFQSGMVGKNNPAPCASKQIGGGMLMAASAARVWCGGPHRLQGSSARGAL